MICSTENKYTHKLIDSVIRLEVIAVIELLFASCSALEFPSPARMPPLRAACIVCMLSALSAPAPGPARCP